MNPRLVCVAVWRSFDLSQARPAIVKIVSAARADLAQFDYLGRETMDPLKKLRWQREFETGITEIDSQHRTMLKIFNRINLELREDSSSAVWEPVLHELLGYALYHFWCEEDLARQYGYDQEKHADATSHFNEHLSFGETINDLRTRLRAGERLTKATLIDFLHDWLAQHITDSDQWLVAFILEKQRLAGERIAAAGHQTVTPPAA